MSLYNNRWQGTADNGNTDCEVSSTYKDKNKDNGGETINVIGSKHFSQI